MSMTDERNEHSGGSLLGDLLFLGILIAIVVGVVWCVWKLIEWICDSFTDGNKKVDAGTMKDKNQL